MAKKEHLNLIVIGHIDNGKSTICGRLFYETGAVTQQQLDKLKAIAEDVGKQTFEYAFVTDESVEERKRGITIDLSHKKFETNKYYFTIIDAPGHRDFVKNMITGASQADAAILVVAATDGVMPQTKEHAYLSKVLGIKQMKVAINKMDAVNFDEKKYEETKTAVNALLKGIGYDISKVEFIPTSGLKGDNITKPSANMPWYKGPTLVQSIDKFEIPEKPITLPLRIPVQDSFSITGVGAVPVGKVITGKLKVNDKVVFMPSGSAGDVKSIEMHHEKIEEAVPGDNIGFNVRGLGKTDVKRGDVCGHPEDKPTVAKSFKAQIIVLSHPSAITVGYTPVFHCHTAQVSCRFAKLEKKLDPKTSQTAQENPEFLKSGDAAIVEIEPTRPMVIEKKSKIPQLSSFAIRDMGATVAAGVCIEVTPKE